jgi:uncharacterized protein (DUF952 family)
MAPAIFHLVLESEFRERCRDGRYTPARFLADGFVHCAADEATALQVARSYFAGAREPVYVLRIDAGRLKSPWRFEEPAPLPGGDGHRTPGALFPHVYGPIELEAVERIGRLSPEGLSWPS